RTVDAVPDGCVHGVASTIPARAPRVTEPASRPPVTRGARPAAIRRSVDAPAPPLPTSATTSPDPTSSETLSSAGVAVAGYQKVTSSSARILMPGARSTPRDTTAAGPSAPRAPPVDRVARRVACEARLPRGRAFRAPGCARPPRGARRGPEGGPARAAPAAGSPRSRAARAHGR